MEDLETCTNNETVKPDLQPLKYSDDIDNTVSTPGPPHSYGGGFFYSAPSSPMRHALSSSYSNTDSVSSTPLEGAGGSFEFEFPAGSMSSADELFLNGQIRPMKLSSHLQRPQDPTPFIDVDEEDTSGRCRNLKSRDRSNPLRRRARSMSLIRTNTAFQWLEEFKDGRDSTEINEIKEKLEAEEKQRGGEDNGTPSSGASSRSSSAGRSSKRWVFLKELLSRSKSEGRNSTSNNKLWSTLSFSLSTNKDKKLSKTDGSSTSTAEGPSPPKTTGKKAVNGVGVNRKRRVVGRSAHEVHYTTNRAQAEEMRKKTYLPYRPGLLGCLGFSSRSYGAMNGFARALNPVSSR